MWDSNDVEYLLILFFLFNPDLFCLVYRAILFFILAVFVRKLIVDYVGIIHKNRNQSCFVSLFFSCLAFNVAPPVIPIVLCGQSSFSQAYNGFNLFCGRFWKALTCAEGGT